MALCSPCDRCRFRTDDELDRAARVVDVATNGTVQKAISALAHVASPISDPAVRHRGTIGGALANDPAADYPAAVLALGATIKTNKLSIAADDFFKGLFATALEEGEIITAVSFPIPAKAGYAKFPHPASRLALAGVFATRPNRATSASP
jgi:aerobic carbon-monoxide dehydrogenase medium subunit